MRFPANNIRATDARRNPGNCGRSGLPRWLSSAFARSSITTKVAIGLGLLLAILTVTWWVSVRDRRSNQAVVDKLTRKVRYEGPWYYQVAKQTHTTQLFPKRLLDPHRVESEIFMTRWQAARDLSSMGTNAWAAVPALVSAVMQKDISIGIPAAETLASIRAEESPEWARLLKHLTGEILAARTFRYLVVGANNCGTPYGLVHRRFGLIALTATGPAAEVAYGDIIEIITYSTETELRVWALLALGGINTKKNDVVPVLKKTLQDPQEWPHVRAAAAQALASAAPKKEETRIVLQQQLQDPRAAVRLGAARALWRTDAPAEQILGVLTPLLTNRLASIRAGALEGIGEMRNAARGSRSQVERLLTDENETVRRAAAAALKNLGGKSGPQAGVAHPTPAADPAFALPAHPGHRWRRFNT